MASQRRAIALTDDEIAQFLAAPRTLSVATLGADGRPHLSAVWYGFVGADIAFLTYRSSQKAVNLRRDPRVTCMAEEGRSYAELRGVTLTGRAEVLDDEEVRFRLALSTGERYEGGSSEPDHDQIRASIAKRVAVRVAADDVASWDHRKLASA
jgi:PPOX class probable F420-dependent enzyme